VRRVVLLSSAFVLLMVATGCRHDGRTLRPPRPDQTSSISTTTIALSTTAVPDTGFGGNDGTGDTTLDTTLGTTLGTTGLLRLTAPWASGATIDTRYTCDGANVSPALAWSAAPPGTVEIAITLQDLQAPNFVHWAVGGIDASAMTIDENTIPVGAYEGTNGNGTTGYTGPCPPAGSTHTYLLAVHYLGRSLQLGDGTPGAAMLVDIRSAELESAQVNGTFSRP